MSTTDALAVLELQSQLKRIAADSERRHRETLASIEARFAAFDSELLKLQAKASAVSEAARQLREAYEESGSFIPVRLMQ